MLRDFLFDISPSTSHQPSTLIECLSSLATQCSQLEEESPSLPSEVSGFIAGKDGYFKLPHPQQRKQSKDESRAPAITSCKSNASQSKRSSEDASLEPDVSPDSSPENDECSIPTADELSIKLTPQALLALDTSDIRQTDDDGLSSCTDASFQSPAASSVPIRKLAMKVLIFEESMKELIALSMEHALLAIQLQY